MKLIETKANYNVDGVYFSGRWAQSSKGMYATNLGAQFYTAVQAGTKITLKLSTNSNPEGVWIAYSIDDQEYQRMSLDQMPLTLELPDSKQHVIRIVYSGNTAKDNVWKRYGGLYLDDIETDGKLTAVKPAGKKITFIGDSITAGAWVAGKTPGKDYRGEANFAAQTANRLGLEDIRIAYAAAGVTKGGAGCVPDAEKFLKKIDAGHPWQPIPTDIVVVNLGTCDRKTNTIEFRPDFEKLLQQIKLMYPKTPMLVMIPFGQFFDDVIREEVPEYPDTQLIETADWPLTFTDGMHPDTPSSKVIADKLVPIVEKYLK